MTDKLGETERVQYFWAERIASRLIIAKIGEKQTVGYVTCMDFDYGVVYLCTEEMIDIIYYTKQ